MKLWIARYWHKHGSDLLLFWQGAEPTDEQVTASILDLDDEADLSEENNKGGYEMYGPYEVPTDKSAS
jgi:hypothetical protein